MFEIPEEIIRKINAASEVIAEFSNKMDELSCRFAEALRATNFEKWPQNMTLFIEAFERLPENQRRVIDELTKCAWYMNSKNGIYMIGNILNLDKDSPYYLNNIDEIMMEDLKNDEHKNYDWILKCFKDREAVLVDAIEDHKIGRYNCSISVFLNQIDGITRDLLGIDKYNNFFKKVPEQIRDNSGKKIKTGEVYPYTKEIAKKLSTNIENDDGILYSFLIYPLERLSCLCYDSDDINKYIEDGTIYCNFSRHGIIHGKDIEYGTEVNSYKCISILLYLCTIKEMLFDKNEVNE